MRPLYFVLLTSLACQPHGQDAGHGHSHGPSGEHEPEAEDEVEPLAITRWTDAYELFVELPPPVPGTAVPYHAHVTRLSDFAAVTEGTFTVRYKKGAEVVREATQEGVKRPGIFVFHGNAPPEGEYQLEMSYTHQGKTDVFDCGSVTVAETPPAPEEGSGGALTFLKESQWKVPFGTAWAAEQSMAKELEIAATVEPAGGDQLTVGAPTAGRFFHNPKLVLGEGLRVKRGDVLGTIAPTVAGDDYSRLQFAVEESALSRDQIQREIDRVTPLVAQGLLPERRLVALRNDLETQSARLRSAGGRLGGVASAGQASGLVIRSSLDGVVAQVLAANGAPVDAGTPLVHIGGTDHLWIRARFVAKPASALIDARPTSVRLPSGETVDLEAVGARFLSTLPVVDPTSRVATWIVDVPAASVADLRSGASVVLTVRIGAARPLLAVPRSAVVEINTRPYVFVQADGEHFDKRSVRLGHTDGPWVHVISGVAKGERVVTRGGFDIHLAALMGTVESHRH